MHLSDLTKQTRLLISNEERMISRKQLSPLTNWEIQKHYQNEPRFYKVYSRKNLFKIKNKAYKKILIDINQNEIMG